MFLQKNGMHANLHRALLLKDPTQSLSEQTQLPSQNAMFTYAVGNALNLAGVKFRITTLGDRQGLTSNWYITFSCRDTQRRAYLNAFGISFKIGDAIKGADTKIRCLLRDDIGHYDFEWSDDSKAWRHLASEWEQATTSMAEHEKHALLLELPEAYGEKLIDNLISQSPNCNKLYKVVRAEAIQYKKWLVKQRWVEDMDKAEQEEFLGTLDNLIAHLKTCTHPDYVWELAVDHWHSTEWNDEQGPDSWKWIYSMLDQARMMQELVGDRPSPTAETFFNNKHAALSEKRK